LIVSVRLALTTVVGAAASSYRPRESVSSASTLCHEK
jgi:hypothetical protein